MGPTIIADPLPVFAAWRLRMGRHACRSVPVRDTEGPRMADSREVMNIRQASQYLGISPDTLYKYASEEVVPAFKLGNRWKFKKSILDHWMEDRSQSSQAPRFRKPGKVRDSMAAD